MLSSVFNWSVAAIVTSITMFSPITLNTDKRVNEVIEEEVAAKGCATNFENLDLIEFHYDGPIPSTTADVEDVSNWKLGPNPYGDCDEDDVIACSLRVSSGFLDPLDPEQLDSSINITAVEDDGNAYVSGTADSNAEFYNRSM